MITTTIIVMIIEINIDVWSVALAQYLGSTLKYATLTRKPSIFSGAQGLCPFLSSSFSPSPASILPVLQTLQVLSPLSAFPKLISLQKVLFLLAPIKWVTSVHPICSSPYISSHPRLTHPLKWGFTRLLWPFEFFLCNWLLIFIM